MFEPDSKLLAAAQQRLIGKHDVEFVPAGAYSLDGELRFSASGRTNGSFSEDGELVIPVKKIDSVVKIPPTFIKMDIEGSETEALRGAAKCITQVQPNIAIAAYHKAQDLWDLVNVIRELNDSYQFYLRQYSETGLETVIYAVDARKSS
jgi:FkbM family methyltransferase